MARPIDAYTLNNDLVSWYNDTEDEKEKSILRRGDCGRLNHSLHHPP